MRSFKPASIAPLGCRCVESMPNGLTCNSISLAHLQGRKVDVGISPRAYHHRDLLEEMGMQKVCKLQSTHGLSECAHTLFE